MENLAELAELDPEQLMANSSPALRAAIERHKTQSRGNGFTSFISPDK
ncbi:hypothetical protein OG874_39465 [Nocardia sp. NBC_00565]|nr:hypothetical protein [Nocardia sp. NBC_00565]WUC02717.1 hypothetical protein OG874_39465 [Nocardia sp. NBC_00565]